MPWRDEQNRLQMLNLSYIIPGFGDISEIGADPSGWLLGNPWVGIGSAIKTKVKYGGAPLYYDQEEPSTKFAKTLAYVWEQMVPSWIPGGVDWNAMWKTVEGQEEAMTFWQQVGAASGFKLKPIDQIKMNKSRMMLDRIHQMEMGSQFKQDLKAARSNEELQEIFDRYSRLKEEMND